MPIMYKSTTPQKILNGKKSAIYAQYNPNFFFFSDKSCLNFIFKFNLCLILFLCVLYAPPYKIFFTHIYLCSCIRCPKGFNSDTQRIEKEEKKVEEQQTWVVFNSGRQERRENNTDFIILFYVLLHGSFFTKKEHIFFLIHDDEEEEEYIG